MNRRKTQREGMLASLRVRVFKRRARRAKRSHKSLRQAAHSFVGRDMARSHPAATRNFQCWLPAGLLGVFFATLSLTALRDELIEVRYAIIAAHDEEVRLREERDLWVSRVQQLRNPARLTALAGEQGFARPDHTIDLRKLRDRSAVADLFAAHPSPRLSHSLRGASR